MHLSLANILGPYFDNWILIIFLALLFFGRRLPEMGRSLGKGIVEFKKGLAGIEEEISQATDQSKTNTRGVLPPAAAGYKFDPYTGKPLTQEPAVPQMKFDPYTGKPLDGASTSQTSSST
jgi:sec-independent protein translocase protein TatA